ncbi:MAG: response regulator [Flavobacteriales bacterium]|nr:response regulator [Flavobacteriales bacterium]
MAQTNVLVVEDESIVSKDIQHSLKKLGYNVVGAANNGETAVSLALEHRPDIILMDIMLKGEMNGIEAADAIRKETNIPVIFLTAYADESTLAKAKVTQPYGYIIKPFKEIDIHTSIEMALYKHKKETEVLKERDLLYSLVENKEAAGGRDIMFVKSNSRLVKLKTSDIYFIEALKDYVVINTLNTRYTVHSTMKDIEAKLPEADFIRVHRSFIVRLDKIVAIEQPNLILENDKKVIPIGGSYKDDLAKRLNLV